jgi:iron(III) transport system substrate-binding protein
VANPTRLLVLLLAAALCVGSCSDRSVSSVTVYVALDRQLAEPILRQFEERTGINVNDLYDGEANKTSGLVNRLIAESSRPRADVFWNNETAQLVRLADANALYSAAEQERAGSGQSTEGTSGAWTPFAGRLRVLIVHSHSGHDQGADPTSIDALTDPRLKGRVAIANPHFGSTGTHFAALLVERGEAKFRAWLRALRANEVAVLAGNAQVKDAVASGLYRVGLTDTDDVNEAILAGKPVRLIVPDQGDRHSGAFLIPNAVALVRGGPNPDNARRLIEFLLSPQVEAALAEGAGAQIPLRSDVPGPTLLPPRSELKLLDVDHDAVGRAYERMLQIVDEEWPS